MHIIRFGSFRGSADSRRTRIGRLAVLGLASLMALGACAAPATPVASTLTAAPVTSEGAAGNDPVAASVGPDGETSLLTGFFATQLEGVPIGTLDDAEQAAIVYMREEEKLAYDVYQELYRVWGSRVFANISQAELTHMASVKVLLDRYGIPDPAANTAAGEFVDPALQALYEELVAKGSTSLVDAFTVGAMIEDLDIADLQERMSSKADIALVFDNLEMGSRNHLRAFNRQLVNAGASYAPTNISQAEFDSIVSAPTERGPVG